MKTDGSLAGAVRFVFWTGRGAPAAPSTGLAYCGGAVDGGAAGSELLPVGAASVGITGAGAAAGLTVVVVVGPGADMLTEGSEVGSAWSGPLRGCGVGRLPRWVIGALFVGAVEVLPGGRPASLSASRRRA